MARTATRQRARTSASGWIDRLVDRLPGPARRVVQRARRDDILLLSAGLAFYALVSIVPMVIVALWITGLIIGEGRIEGFANRLGEVAPKDIGLDRAIRGAAEQGTRLGLTAAFAGLWPATAYGSGLAQAFRRITPHPDRRRGNALGRGLALIGILPLFILGSILAVFAGTKVVGDAVAGRMAGPVIAILAGFAIAAVAIGLIYVLFPPESLRPRAVLKATSFAAAGVSILSLLFVLYVSQGANFEQRYATSGTASVVLLAVWLYLSNVLLLVGYKIGLEADPTSDERPPNHDR